MPANLDSENSGRTARLIPCFVLCVVAAVATTLWLAPRVGAPRAAAAQAFAAAEQRGCAAAAQAMAAQQQGNFAEAEKDWRTAVAQNPQDAVAYANLGFVLAHQEKY